MAYPDATKAYDRVNREKLWRELEKIGVPTGMIDLVKLIYKDNKVRVEHGGYESRWMRTKDGLKQGCPLSSILFAL